MQTNQFIKNAIELLQSGVLATVYLGIWFICNKKLKKGAFKAFLIGFITPFFFYNFALKFVNSMGYFLYKTGLFRDSHGVLYLMFAIFVKPLSVFLGIIITLILLVEDDFMNELRK